MTNNLTGKVILPSEWDKRVSSVLLSFPHALTDWNYMLDEARQCFINIIKALIKETNVKVIIVTPEPSTTRQILLEYNIDCKRFEVLEAPTDDTWARDFGPLTVFADGKQSLLDFKFNGWGLKFRSAADNMICRNIFNAPTVKTRKKLVNYQDFVLEGGSIESDGLGTIMTTSQCLLSPNRNAALSKQEIEIILCHRLGAERVLWLEHGFLAGDDTDSHIDTLARFVDEKTISYVKCDDEADIHYKELLLMEKELKGFKSVNGQSYHLIPLPLPHPVFDEDGKRLPATYANFLITPSAVLLPVYNQPDKDEKAVKIIQKAFPEHKVITVDCSALIKQHGSLHCVTMQMYL